MPLELHHSRVFTQLMITAHLLSLNILWLAKISMPLKIILLGGILLSAIQIRRTMRTLPRLLTLTPNREVVLAEQDEEQIGTLLSNTLVTPFLVVLRFQIRITSRTYSVPIFYDALPSEQFRALRVQLKLNS